MKVALALTGLSNENDIVQRLAHTAGRDGIQVERVVDVVDLIAVARIKHIDLVLIAASFPRLDGSLVQQLAESSVRVIGCIEDESDERQLRSVGISQCVDSSTVTAAALTVPASLVDLTVDQSIHEAEPLEDVSARVTVVWGPPGAPGRTSVAIGLAQLSATAGERTLLIDLDTVCPGIGSTFAIAAGASGVIAAVRHGDVGQLDAATLARCVIEVSPRVDILTGIGQRSRRTELRASGVDAMLRVARQVYDRVILDVGPLVDADSHTAIVSSGIDAGADVLQIADEVVVVTKSDTESLRRLLDHWPTTPLPVDGSIVVAVNQVVDASSRSIRDLVEVVSAQLGAAVVTLPRDHDTFDRAASQGRTVFEIAPHGEWITAVSELDRHLPVVGGVTAIAG